MSARRCTPTSKELPCSSRRQTPNHNTTALACGSGSGAVPKTLRSGTGSKFSRAHSNPALNLNNTVVGCPAIKSNLSSCNTVDKKLEYDMAYNDYLLALMKKQIALKIIKKHEQDMKDQLAIQKDTLHKMKTTLKNLRREIDNLDTLLQIDELTSVIQENINTFLHLSEELDLNEVLANLLELFELLCNKLHLKNIQPMTDQESIDKLTALLEKCLDALTKIESSGRAIELVQKLSELMKKYQQLVSSVSQQQTTLNKQQLNESFKILKTLSGFYAQRENYPDAGSSK